MLVKIKDILPNPFRNIEHYPINREKVDALKASFDKTEYWDNVLGRVNDKGRVEQAYGHHRKLAAEEHYGSNHRIEIIIRALTDGEMIQVMAAENMEEWGSNAIVDIETVEAVVKAFAANKITLSKLPQNLRNQVLRHAPSFIISDRPEISAQYPYTAQQIAEFLGWTYGKDNRRAADKVYNALTALQYIEEKILKLSDFKGMPSSGIRHIVEEARRARQIKETRAREAERLAKEAEQAAQEAEQAEERASEQRRMAYQRAQATRLHEEAKEAATKVGKAVSRHLQDKKKEKEIVRDVAKNAEPPRQPKKLAQIEEYLSKALSEIYRFLSDGHPLAERLDQVLEFKDELDEDVLENAQNTLRTVRDRLEWYAKRFEPGKDSAPSKPSRLALRN